MQGRVGSGGVGELSGQRLLVDGTLNRLQVWKLVLKAVDDVLSGHLFFFLRGIRRPDNEVWMRELRSNRRFIVRLLNVEPGAETGRRRVLIEYADNVQTLVIVQGVVGQAHRFRVDAKGGIFHVGESVYESIF